MNGAAIGMMTVIMVPRRQSTRRAQPLALIGCSGVALGILIWQAAE